MPASNRQLRNKLGNQVMGDDFWPRPDIVDRLYRDMVDDKGSRGMFALRRIGKSSVLSEVERRLRAETKITVIHINVQNVTRIRDFMAMVFAEIPSTSRTAAARKKFIENPALQNIFTAVATRVIGKQPISDTGGLVNEFDHAAIWVGDIEATLKAAGPIILIIDELPYMMRAMLGRHYKPADAEQFLAMLISWRKESGVRMLFAGSIGLRQFSRESGVRVGDLLSDVVPVDLPPLAPHDAIAMVDALARGESAANWSTALSPAIVVESAETWPIFLQYGFDAIHRVGTRDPASVGTILAEPVRPALDATFYQQFSTRLAQYGKDETGARITLKTIVASGGKPTKLDAIDAALTKAKFKRQDELLEALREDNFIVFDTQAQTAQPASRLVPIWVRARAWGR